MLATLRMNGIGIGMMSPSGPARARKSLGMLPFAVAPTMWWNAEPSSVAGRPAARMLGSHTGMNPPLVTIATAFSRMPTKASGRPACSRFIHSAIRRRRKPPAKRGSRRLLARSLPLSIANWVA